MVSLNRQKPTLSQRALPQHHDPPPGGKCNGLEIQEVLLHRSARCSDAWQGLGAVRAASSQRGPFSLHLQMPVYECWRQPPTIETFRLQQCLNIFLTGSQAVKTKSRKTCSVPCLAAWRQSLKIFRYLINHFGSDWCMEDAYCSVGVIAKRALPNAAESANLLKKRTLELYF